MVPEADATDFTKLLLTSMAQYHRVLVVSGSTESLPLVHGGPVYKMKSPRPTHVADVVNGLQGQPGQPISILIHAAQMESALLNDYADLMPGSVGAAIVVHNSYSGPETTVTVERRGSGWILHVGSKQIELTFTEWGLSVTDKPADSDTDKT